MDQSDAQVRLVADDGTLLKHDTYKVDLSDDELRDLYVKLVVVRRIDTEGTNLQRQGQLGIWAPCLGQEAAQVGSGCALAPGDFVFPSYREHGVAYVRGVDIMKILQLYRGVSLSGWDPHEKNFALYTIPIGTQALHAVGYAIGAKWDGAEQCTAVYFGDGGTSEGDTNEAFNFAAVNSAPVVFFCQNNQWAISVPLSKQMAAPIWRRSYGFGFPGVQVGGNDVVAVLALTGPPTTWTCGWRASRSAATAPSSRRPACGRRSWTAPPRARRTPPPPGSAPRSRRCRRRRSRTWSTTSTPIRPPRCGGSSSGYSGSRASSSRRRAEEWRRSPWPRRSTRRCATPWRPTARSSSSARTSAPSAVSSASPTACSRTSASSGSWTPRWPSPASSASPSGWPSAATAPCPRCSSTASATPRSTRSSATWPSTGTGPGASSPCRWSYASPSAAASARSSTTPRARRRSTLTPPGSRSWPRRRRLTPTRCCASRSRSTTR